MSTPLMLVGHVAKPHGVRGEMRMRIETDDPSRLERLPQVWIGSSAETARAYPLQRSRTHQTSQGLLVLLLVEGITTPEAASLLRGMAVYAHRDHLPPLQEEEFYLDDLYGMKVWVDGRVVGEVEEVLELPSHPVITVRLPEGDPVMVPLVEAFLTRVNGETQTVHLNADAQVFFDADHDDPV
jgi:16S rRNA processing protein RimM